MSVAPGMTPEQAREAGYTGWCAHLGPVCIRESPTVYCATCDPWRDLSLRIALRDTPPQDTGTEA